MARVVAVLETMWDWRGQTSAAGYREAPPHFRINPRNRSGARLYKLVGPSVRLLVTNACRELVTGPEHHGKGDPEWLRDNLAHLDGLGAVDLLLVCGKIAQKTYAKCGYEPSSAPVLLMPHPTAWVWTRDRLTATMIEIQEALADG